MIKIMTDLQIPDDVREFENMVYFYIDLLRLNDWELSIYVKSLCKDAGESMILLNDNLAVIEIESKLSGVEIEQTLIHELLHVVHREEYEIAVDKIESSFVEYYIKHHERMIERSAKLIYNLVRDGEVLLRDKIKYGR